MSTKHQLKPSQERVNEMNQMINGYWERDRWNLCDSFFGRENQPLNVIHTEDIDFSRILNPSLRIESKYYFAKRLTEKTLKLGSMSTYRKGIHSLAIFLNQYYPTANSFVEILYDKAKIQHRSFLISRNIRLHNKKTTPHETVFKQLCKFYHDFYDTRDEFDKDIWDIRKIPGAKLSLTKTEYLLTFDSIPEKYRPFVKRYFKMKVYLIGINQLRENRIALAMFFRFLEEHYPEWIDLSRLNRGHMEKYMVWHKENYPQLTKNYWSSLYVFLEYIERAEYPEAPKISVNRLLFREEITKKPLTYRSAAKYIPEEVIQQLEDNLEYLSPSEYIPIVILLRASGWRISDILNLRYDTCLHRTDLGWYLQGDIVKTNVKRHKVPITDEVAAMLKILSQQIAELSTEETNPNRFLFARLSGPRVGKPILAQCVQHAMNRLAKQKNILDKDGNIYRFGNHAFRHTKAVELINNGMDLIHVQKWMAHMSPEMTLHYAQILDDTMRRSWEEATKNGLFRINENGGKPMQISGQDIEQEDSIEWEYIRHNLDAVQLELGYCMKPIKQPCPTQANPCLSCRNFCTTPDFLPQYEIEIRRAKEIITRGKNLGRNMWVEKNQTLLNRLEPILEALQDGKVHHMAGKKGREYTGEERHDDSKT
ncbi:tyrosine-type recombinase/integrase [Shimazuella sp. AN120528]|uniref:tyrosine-type recombinase/integrase n=1 Tax=Shimazuella soli TaxID=1892854 RepID=UPI001F0ECC76|nr:tyrosine-type recombinase/integrase [Shimazuella soli]MCH5583494.1 tyrosine-type recombinase/integrase [Shimazuella soli]